MGRTQIIAEAIDQSWIFKDIDVPLYPALIKTISTQYWKATDLGKWAALVNGTNVIPTLVSIDLLEEDITVITQHYEDQQYTAVVSATEVRT